MAFKTIALAAATAVFTLPVFAGEIKIMIMEPYARSGAKTGAAFFTIMNHSDTADRLIGVTSKVAPRVELHTHLEDANGVVKMREIEGGIEIPGGGTHSLERGGDHVMFMGLDAPLEQGADVKITLMFEQAGAVDVVMPVDNDRKTTHGSDHSDHSSHGTKDHSDH